MFSRLLSKESLVHIPSLCAWITPLLLLAGPLLSPAWKDLLFDQLPKAVFRLIAKQVRVLLLMVELEASKGAVINGRAG